MKKPKSESEKPPKRILDKDFPHIFLLYSVNELAMAFGVSNHAVKMWPISHVVTTVAKSERWPRKGMQLFDVRDAVQYQKRTVIGRPKGPAKEETPLEKRQAALAEKRGDLMQFKIDLARGKYILFDDVVQGWSDMLHHFRAVLDGMPSRAGRAVCAAFGIAEQIKVETILHAEKNAALEKLSEYGKDE